MKVTNDRRPSSKHNAQQAFSGGAQQSTGSATRAWGYAASVAELLPHAPPKAFDGGCTGAVQGATDRPGVQGAHLNPWASS
jgi:hypothetical protein